MTTKPKAKKFRIRRSPSAAMPMSGQTARPIHTSDSGQPNVAPAQAVNPPRPIAQTAPQPISAAPAPQESQPTPAQTPLNAPQPATVQQGPQQPASSPTAPAAQTQAAPAAQTQAAPTAQAKAAPTQPQQPAMTGQVSSAAQIAGETDIEAIRQEGLTGRQLRMARRVAQSQGLEPTSDFDAVRLLRARGIDPFQRSNVLDLVAGDQAAAGPQPAQRRDDDKIQLPQTIALQKTTLPSTETNTISPAERRAAEIFQVQKDLARRRRKKFFLLLTRLAVFVLLPSLVAGYYFYAVATPMYGAKSEFLILKSEAATGGVGGLLTGTQFATSQDSIAVQSYLTSKDAMLRLDQDVGFKEHFTQDWIDPIQRLNDNPSNEEAYALYKRHVEIGYDPADGVIRMEVMAADPELAASFSRALIQYAEDRVDNLSSRKRSNAVQDAEFDLQKAEDERRIAQEKLVRLQQDGEIIDPQGRISALRGQINSVEVQLQEKNLQLQALLDNARPNTSKVQGTEGDIRRLENLLADLNSQMTTATEGEDSLAEKAIQIRMAEADLATRDFMLQASLERLEQARRDADSQARFLTTSVKPVPAQDPAYPRKFENTMLAFLIFSGIYLMLSLTASILREQVSA